MKKSLKDASLASLGLVSQVPLIMSLLCIHYVRQRYNTTRYYYEANKERKQQATKTRTCNATA